jgi:hypothetical protein
MSMTTTLGSGSLLLDTEGEITFDAENRKLSWPTSMDGDEVRHMSCADDPDLPAINILTADGVITLTLTPGLTFSRLEHIVMATGTFEARNNIVSALLQWGIRRGEPLPV